MVRITATAPEPGSLPLLAGELMPLVGVGLVRRGWYDGAAPQGNASARPYLYQQPKAKHAAE